MKEIKCWETADGNLFKDKDEAIRYELEKQMKQRMTEFVNNYFYRDISVEFIVDIMIENKDEIVDILSVDK